MGSRNVYEVSCIKVTCSKSLDMVRPETRFQVCRHLHWYLVKICVLPGCLSTYELLTIELTFWKCQSTAFNEREARLEKTKADKYLNFSEII